MANQELRALIRIGGDGSGAQTAMRQVAASAQALGANVVKVQETVNTALDRRIEATKRRMEEMATRLQAIDRETRQVAGKAFQAMQEKGSIDPKIAGSVQAIVKANTALIRSEFDLTKAIHDRDKALVDGTKAEVAAQNAARALDQARAALRKARRDDTTTDEQLAAAELRVEQAEKQDEIATANLSIARLRYEDITKRVAMAETQRAARLVELNSVESQAGEQTRKLAEAQYKLEEATQKQLKAEDRLAKAQTAAATRPTKTNAKELEVARRALAKATEEVTKADDEYQRELQTTNQMQQRSAQLEHNITELGKQGQALEREKVQVKRQLEGQEDKLLGLEERQLNVTYKNTGANRAANTEWQKTVSLVRVAGQSYAAAGRQMAVAAREAFSAARLQAQQIRQGIAAVREHARAAQQLGIAWRNPLSLIKAGSPAFAALGRSLVATAKSMGLMVKGTTQLVAALGRVAGGVSKAISGMSRMNGIAKSLGVGFATTGAHVGGIAVRLNAMQMGLYAAGGAMTKLGDTGKQVFGDLLKTAGDFQQQLVTITATLGKDGPQWTKEIRDEAIRLGEKTMYDPNDAAKVMTDLIRGGMTADTVVNGTAEAVLNLAQATGEDLDTAVKAVVTSTTQWASDNLTAKDAVDQLTRAANASAATVEQLSGGLKNLGGVPATLGVSHEDTLALLGALSEAGLKGPEGGTALRYFFLNLIPGTQKQIELMKEMHLLSFDLAKDQEYLGKGANVQAMNQEQLTQALWEKWSGTKRLFQEAINQDDPAVARFQQFMARNQLITSEFVDQKTGELKDASQLMQTLWDKFGTMDPAQRAKQVSAIFGERGGSKGALNLINAYGTNLEKFQSGATDSKGNKLSEHANLIDEIKGEMEGLGDAQSVAEQRTKTYAGAVERLGSTFQSLKISIGEPLLAPLAGLLNRFSDFVSKVRLFLEANPKVLEMVGKVGLVVTGLASVLGPLTMLSAAFPYLIAGLRGVMLAAAPMTLMFTLLAAVISGVMLAVTDPKLGVMPVLKMLGATVDRFMHELGPLLQQFFDGVIVPIGVTIALLLRDVILPAVINFINWLGQVLPGAISQASGFVQGVLIPAFVNLVGWIGSWLPGAINLLGQIWNNLLLPLLGGLGGIIQEHAMPMLGALGNFFSEFIPAAINIFMGIWNNVLGPAISWLAGIIEAYVLPILGQLFSWLGEVLPPVFQFLGYVLQTYVFPFVGKLIEILGMVLPPVMGIVGVIIQFLIPVFKFAFDTIGPIILTLLDIVIWVFNLIGGALNWLGEEWGKGFFGMREPLEGLWQFIVDLWNNIVGAFKWLGDKIGGFLEWLGVKAKDGGDAAGQNFGDALGGQLDACNADVKEQVGTTGLTFASLAGPAGLSGYTAGWNFSGGILDGINANIPGIQAAINQITEALNNTLKQFEEVKNSAPQSVIDNLDQKAQRLNANLFRNKVALAAAQKSPFAPGQYGNTPSGTDGTDGSSGNDGSDGNQYDKQTDNRAGQGGGGGGGGGSTTRTAAEAAADEAKKVFDAVKAGIEAFRQLSRMQIPQNVEAKAREFATAVAAVVKQVASVARAYIDKDGKTPLLDAASAFGEAAGKAFDMITKGIEAFSKLKDFEAPAKDALDAFLRAVKYVQDQVVAIAGSGYTAEQLVQSEQFAEAATKSMDMLDKGLDAFAKVGKFVKPAQERLHDLVETIKVAVREVAAIADDLGPEAQATAAEYAGHASTIVDSIGKVADLVAKLNDPKLDLKPVTDKVQALANEMLAMMNYVGGLWTQNPGWTPENAAKVAALGDSAAKVSSGLTGVADMLSALEKDGGKTNYAGLADRVRELADAMLAMMNYLGPLSAPWDGFTEIPAKFSEDGGKVAGGLVALMDMFKALSDKETARIEFRNLAGRVTELANALAQMVNAVRTSVGAVPDVAGLSDYVDVAQKSADSLMKLVDLFKAMGEKGLQVASPDAINELVGRMVGLVTDYSTALSSAGVALDEEGVNIAKAQGDVADSIGKIVASLQSTLDLLDKASHFKAGRTDPHTVIQALLSFMLDFTGQFEAARADFERAVSAETAQLADDIGKVVSSLGSTLDTFDKLSSFKGIASTRIAAFIDTLRTTVTQLGPLVEEIAPEMLDLAKDFGEKLGPAFDTLQKALDLFIGITGKRTEDGKVEGGLRPVDPDAIGEFTGKLRLLIDRLRDDLLTQVAPEMLDLAEQFAQKFGPAMDTLTGALDFFLKIQKDDEGKGGLKPIDPDAIGAVVGSLYIMMNHWRNLITGNNGEFQSAEFAQRSDAFRAVASTVLSSLNEILDLATQVATANEKGAIDNLPHLIEKLVESLRTATNLTLPQSLQNVQTEFQGMFGDTEGLFREKLDSNTPGTIANRWYGKTEGVSLLYSMWYAIEGKGGLRTVLRLAFEGMFQDIGDKFEEWGGALKNQWSAVMADLRSMTASALNDIRSALEGFTQGSITVSVTVTGLNVPALASGGIATRPTLALIGDGHEPEAVVPLSKAQRLGFGQGPASTTNNYYNIRQAQVNQISDLARHNRRARRLQNDMS